MPSATMKLRLSSCDPIFIPIGSLMKVVRDPLATKLSSWQNATKNFNFLRSIPSFSTTLGLTRHLVQRKSNKAISLSLHPDEGHYWYCHQYHGATYWGIVVCSTFTLCRVLEGFVGVPLLSPGCGVNSAIYTSLRTISQGLWDLYPLGQTWVLVGVLGSQQHGAFLCHSESSWWISYMD